MIRMLKIFIRDMSTKPEKRPEKNPGQAFKYSAAYQQCHCRWYIESSSEVPWGSHSAMLCWSTWILV